MTGQNVLSSTDLTRRLALGDDLDAQIGVALDAYLAALVGSLERELGRALWIRQVTETVQAPRPWSLVPDTTALWWGLPLALHPVQSIDSISVGGTVMPGPYDQLSLQVLYGQSLNVTYTAGADHSTDEHLKGLLTMKAYGFAQILTGAVAAAISDAANLQSDGLVVPTTTNSSIKNFHVEGLQVTYRTPEELAEALLKIAGTLATTATWSPAELAGAGLSRLRRRVVA